MSKCLNLVSIRGAITVSNSQDSIVAATRKLFERMCFKNGICDQNIVNVIISTTADITAFYPARAIRESGHTVPLFSCAEPAIDGALQSCIRIMITAYSEHEVKNIYIGGARVLRNDICGNYAIALDGPSGAGKSTVAKSVAATLGIMYLDTGALYRALGLYAVKNMINVSDAVEVERGLNDVTVDIVYNQNIQRVLLNGDDVSDKIRTPEISMAASAVSAIPYVRQKLLGLQRKIAAKNNVILDGRDIGTVVIPNAEFKFFLTASAEVRAKRRYEELIAKGEGVTYDDVLQDVIKRDSNDSTRAIAPLKRAYDAVEIDSDGLNVKQVCNIIIGDVKEIL